MITDRQSYSINFLKGILPIMVVVFHTSSGKGLDYHNGLEPFLRVLIVNAGGMAVPIFFFISGLLFFDRMQEWDWTIWKTKTIKRIKTLFLPFVLWIAITFIMRFVWGILKNEIPGFNITALLDFFASNGGFRMFYDKPVAEYSYSVLGYAVNESKPFDVPLWYVRDLMVLVILSPLIWKFIKKAEQYAILTFLGIYILDIGLPFVLVTPVSLFFYSFGAAFSISGKDFLEYFKRFRIPSYILYAVFFVLSYVVSHPSWNGMIYRCSALASVIAVFNVTSFLSDSGKIKPVKLLTDSSFFIYASHTVLITEISNFLLWRILPITAEWMLVLKVFLRPAVAVGICLFIFVAMRKICPKALGALTGGRF